MVNKENITSFSYAYSSTEQEEIRKIRGKYETKEDGMTRLRKLDAEVTRIATVRSLIIGIIGTLVMGTGMSLIMTDLGTVLSLNGRNLVAIGFILGVVGILLVALAYPIYAKVLKKQRKKVAPEIIKLADELLK